MAMLATRPQYAGSGLASGSHYRATPGSFTSPTESEFSEVYEAADSVRSWDETRVGEWLKSINCGQYIDLFHQHNINGENLMDLDQTTLKELGVNKVGDRVRINSQAKLFRTSAARRTSRRSINRQSLAMLDNTTHAPLSAASPRTMHSARNATTSRADKRLSRHFDLSNVSILSSRPSSPLVDLDTRVPRSGKHSILSPQDQREPSYIATSIRSGQKSASIASETPQTARFPPSIRASPSFDNMNAIGGQLPLDKALIRVIFDSGRSSVVNINGCKSAEDVVYKTLKKGLLNEQHWRSYCFYLLEGLDPNPVYCRRLSDSELLRIVNDRTRTERGRLILRKIHAGEPDGEQLRVAAKLAESELTEQQLTDGYAKGHNKTKSQMKVEKLMGESLPLPSVTYPMSPASETKTRSYFEGSLKRTESSSTTASARARKLKDFYGQRPPTELITQDLTSYFPDVEKDKMDKTVRMSIRRSQRLSRAAHRLSTASNFSFASSLKDAPPLPTIADTWLNSSSQKPLRPLSVIRLGRPQSDYRNSMASVLEPLSEDSAFEPSRKSYVSFGDGSGSDSAGGTTMLTGSSDNDGAAVMQSYFDDSAENTLTDGGESLNSRLSRVIAEDSEEDDEELMEHLENDSWEDLKYMKGAMIGQGSFGTVYLALHAITGELMALKQVEMPSSNNTAADDKKKYNMVEALKREIDLLKELKHPNIVQYLGSNSDESHLNIFLEYVAGGSVATMLVNYGSLPEPLISNFVRQILHGLAYLHSKDIIHRDIKGANILVDNHGSVKISDFGISKRVESTLRKSTVHGLKSTTSSSAPTSSRANPRVSLQGSVFWMAPEVVKQTAYTRKADIWSLGCLIVEMMTGSHPHPNCTQIQAIFKIGGSGEAKPDIPTAASREVRAFLERTFEIEHESRPSADELLGFAFVEDKAKSVAV